MRCGLKWLMETARQRFRLGRGVISFVVGAGVFSLSAAIESVVNALHVSSVWQWADNCAGALATGMIVYLYEQRRHRKALARLRTIAQMNHHIRNALQPMLYMAGGNVPREQQMRMMRECVERIEWALTDVLPSEAVGPEPADRQPKYPPGDAS
jgi:hypothetical protein